MMRGVLNLKLFLRHLHLAACQEASQFDSAGDMPHPCGQIRAAFS